MYLDFFLWFGHLNLLFMTRKMRHAVYNNYQVVNRHGLVIVLMHVRIEQLLHFIWLVYTIHYDIL